MAYKKMADMDEDRAKTYELEQVNHLTVSRIFLILGSSQFHRSLPDICNKSEKNMEKYVLYVIQQFLRFYNLSNFSAKKHLLSIQGIILSITENI